jgi:hypothetical protein
LLLLLLLLLLGVVQVTELLRVHHPRCGQSHGSSMLLLLLLLPQCLQLGCRHPTGV